MESTMPKVSIIVLAYDSLHYLVRTIESYLSNTAYENYEMIISHNPCGNKEIEDAIESVSKIWIENSDNNFKYIRNPTNIYHGPGIMAGMNLVNEDTKYVVLSNDDVFIPGSQEKWLSKLVDFLEKNPKVMSVTPSLYSEKETVYWIGKQDPKQPHHDFLHVAKGDPILPKNPISSCYNNFAICLVRKNLIDEFKIGISCPHYGSDSEFYNRVKEKYPEMESWVIPEIKLYHFNIFYKRINHNKDKIVEG